ncbi:uncharacterized protein LOC130113370 [Lampris incognitus]|uniref:uncharacterized protein LOC130113370 n=1 Tax=Lampris incognitus TaxID=2546036 RepID=UPI0024B5777C|nr:uncharacterized protein LOC130113370 [Lampris incognitus]
MSRRRCFLRCEGKFPLYGLPKKEEGKSRWLRFLSRTTHPHHHHQRQQHSPSPNPKLVLCSLHFTEDCFLNWTQYTAGFCTRLLLKDGAIPTLLGRSGASGSPPATSSNDPSTMEHIGTNIVCQQASLQLPNSRTTMVQLVSPTGIVLLTPTLSILPLFASSSDLPTAKCSESESKTNSVACQCVNLQVQEKGTYMYTRPTRTRSKGIQVKVHCKDAYVNANEKHLENLESSETQHVIDEESILELLKYCPKCNRQCRCTKKTKGVYFIVIQSCYFCEYRRKWANQPEAKDIPITSCRRKQRKKKRPQLDKVSVNISIQPSDLKECYVVLGHPCPIPHDQ